MPRFFVEQEDINEKNAVIRGADAVHIGRSLRMRLGDELTVCCEGRDYICKIDTISDEQCTLTVLSSVEGQGEPKTRLTLYQAVPKGDKLDTIVQKSVELGAAEIVPVLTARCVSRPDEKSFRKKRERLSRIALEAAKQCGRSIVPEVGEMITLDECAKRLGSHAAGLICYEKGGADTGDEVTLTVTPNEGYQLSTLTVKDADENEITVTDNTFTMPASNVTVSASFELKKFTVKWKIGETVVETDENVIAHADLVLDEKTYRNADEAYWENSDIRTWLNSDFYASAFSEENKAVMVTEEVENKINADSHIYGGENTLDKVWLLSYYEMTADNGFPAMVLDKDAFLDASDYAYSQGACYGVDNGYSKVDYFLRDVGATAASVCYDSSIFTRPYMVGNRAKRFISCRNHLGVLPVIAISKTAEIANSVIPSSEPGNTPDDGEGGSDSPQNPSGEKNDGTPKTPETPAGEGSETQKPAGYGKEATCNHSQLVKTVKKKADFSSNGELVYKCKSCSKEISKKSVPSLKSVKLDSREYVYKSGAVSPVITVKNSKGAAVKTDGYSVKFINRKNNKAVSSVKQVGQYKAVITFKGEYSGEKALYFSVKPSAPKIKSYKKTKKGIKIKWKKSSPTGEYQLLVADNKKFKSAKAYKASAKKSAKLIKKLKKGKKYYVKIRSCKTVKVDKRKAYMYSDWSKTKTVKN